MSVNVQRADARRREDLLVFVSSSAWLEIVNMAEEEIIRPLRVKALTDANLDPREHTGVVRSLLSIRKLIELPYKKLAESSDKKLEDVLPETIRRLFS